MVDLLQQCYNIADTLIVGQFLGEKALAAVGSSFTLMTFITSIILGSVYWKRSIVFYQIWAEGRKWS